MTDQTKTSTARPLAAGITKKSTSYNADPKRICLREGWNNRFDLGDIETLAAGIKESLARDPARPYGTDMDVKRLLPADPRAANFDFEVVTGHRRYAATQILLKAGVEFPEGVNIRLVSREQSDLDSLRSLYIENNQKPLLPLEEAAAFKRFEEAGLNYTEIAKVVGKSVTHVAETLQLLTAAPELQEAVKSGAVGKTLAKTIMLASPGDAAAQASMAAVAVKGGAKAVAPVLRAAQVAKAAKAGRVLKMRALSDDQLSEIGAKMAKHLVSLLKEAKLDSTMTQATLQEWVKADESLAAAYAAGAVDALKVAAGVTINLEV